MRSDKLSGTDHQVGGVRGKAQMRQGRIALRCPDCKVRIRDLSCANCGRDFRTAEEWADFLPRSETSTSDKAYLEMPDTYESLKHTLGARRMVADWSVTKIEDTNLTLMDYVRPQSNLRVLEIGSGRGYFCKIFNEKYPDNTYAIVEYSPANIKYGLKLGFYRNASLVFRGSVYSLPFEDNEFDLVVGSEVLEHLEHLDRALSEMNRVLRTDGHVIASSPNSLMHLYPLPLAIALLQTLHHPRDPKKGFRVLNKRLRREIDDNTEGWFDRPFLPGQFAGLFERRNYAILRHITSILYFYYPPFSSLIMEHPNALLVKWLTRATIKLSDYMLKTNAPIVKWMGSRQHMVARK